MFLAAVAGKPDLGLVTPREATARVSVMEAMYRSSSGAPLGSAGVGNALEAEGRTRATGTGRCGPENEPG